MKLTYPRFRFHSPDDLQRKDKVCGGGEIRTRIAGFSVSPESWTTAHELAHLGLMGGFSSFGIAAGRLQLLRNYLAAMQWRSDWGNLDSYKIEEFVLEAIQREQRNGIGD